MDLNYRKVGAGKPIIIIHGLYGSSDNWLTIARKLGETHSVYSVDLRNHGNSPHDEEMTLRAMAGDIVEFVGRHKLDGASIIAHSLGGKVAMLAALELKERLEKLVIVDIAPLNYETYSESERIRRFHSSMIETLSNSDLTRFERREEIAQFWNERIKDINTCQFLLKGIEKDGNHYRWKINIEAIKRNIREMLNGIPLDFAERRISTPTLFIKGENSPYLPESAFGLIRQVFENVKIETFYGTTHWLHYEEPGRFLERVGEWLG